MKTRIALLGVLMLVACQSGRSQPVDSDADKKDNGKFYQVAVTPADAPVDEKTSLVVSFTPGSGYKWNDEYPTKMELLASDAYSAEKTSYSGKAKDIEISQTAARVTIELVARKGGEQQLKLKGNWSVCNDTSCKIFKNEEVSLAFTGK